MLGRGVTTALLAVGVLTFIGDTIHADEIYKKAPDINTRWSTFENLNSVKGAGGRANQGAKGHPMEPLRAGETKTLLDYEGSGTIRRIWMTLQPLRRTVTPTERAMMLRAVRLDMFWDRASEPAVSVPLGDFFGAILGRPVVTENAFFSNPESRSFNCILPMPFRTGAKVTVTNESDSHVGMLFYEINFTTDEDHGDEALYFHAHWRRENPTTLGKPFAILPRVEGEGRFLGTHIGGILDADNVGWWGEGEVKVFLDGDTELPTLVGTGTEDYIGTGWGQGAYQTRYQGSLIADPQNGHYTFYRYHVPDPVYFHENCKVVIQQMGGADKPAVIKMVEDGVPIKPVTVTYEEDGVSKIFPLLDQDPGLNLTDPSVPDGWTNYYRQDDWSAVAFFYLDRPTNGLPPLADVDARTARLQVR